MARVSGPFIGVDRSQPSHKIPLGSAEDALNCVLSNGRIEKRQGYAVNGTGAPANPVLGMHDFLKADGSKIQIVKVGGSLYKNVAGTLTAITSGGGFSTTELCAMRTVADRVYIADAGSVPKVTDGTTCETLVVAPPPYAPNPAVGSGDGPLRGVYDYKYTYYSTTWGIESPSSPSKIQSASADQKTTTLSVTDGFIVLTNFSASSDTRFDRYRLYRRNVGAKAADWFFVEELSDAVTTYNDYTPDRSQDTVLIAPLSYTQTLPAFRFLEIQNEVLFFAGADSDPNGIYFSPPSKPGAAVQRLPIDPGGGGVTGLLAIAGELAIFCRNSIYLLHGVDRQTFTMQKVIPNLGCVASQSIVAVGDTVYFLSEQGFVRWNFGSALDPDLSVEVQDLVLTRNVSRDKYLVAEHDDDNKSIIWLYASAGSSTQDAMLVFFYQNSQDVNANSWCPWVVPNVTYLKLVTDPTSLTRSIAYGFTNGTVGRYGGENDNLAAVPWFWQTGRVDEGEPNLSKRWGELRVEVTKQTMISPVIVSVLIDESVDPIEVLRFYQTESPKATRIRRRGRRLAVKFANSHIDAPTELVSWELEGIPAGKPR